MRHSGQILLDGVDIRELSFSSLRGAVAMVSQETYIFMGTVAENIAYARPDATRDEIVEAAIAASAHPFICRLPDGYDTVIGAGGRNLSGGNGSGCLLPEQYWRIRRSWYWMRPRPRWTRKPNGRSRPLSINW